MWPIIGGAISGLMNFFGGKSNNDAIAENNARNIAAQQAINQQNIDAARENNALTLADKQRDRDMQLQFAQSGIRWKTDDARAAGIHPLYAMGANTVSYAPSTVGLATPSLSAATTQAATGMGNAMAASGQDISRALNATRSGTERLSAAQSTANALSLENMGLQNELIRSQIAKINSGLNPPFPLDPYKIEGQSSSGIKAKDVEIEASGKDPSISAGAVADSHFARTPGGWANVPSKDMKDRMEDQMIPELQWAIRNNLGPIVSDKYFVPPRVELPRGYMWVHNPLTGEYRQEKTRFQERWEGRR